jgi:hypothetical protein
LKPTSVAKALEAEIARAAEVGRMGGEQPLDYMLRTMRDPQTEPSRRDMMARAAAPYMHAALQATAVQHLDAQGNPIGPRIVEVERQIEHKPQTPVIIDGTVVGDTRH